jgi:hypothetical protein
MTLDAMEHADNISILDSANGSTHERLAQASNLQLLFTNVG